MMQCQLLRDSAQWIVDRPYRDRLFADWLSKKQKELSELDASRLEQTLKLFDWTIRNIALEGGPKDVETLPANPSLPLHDNALGYRSLPYQTVLLGHGDAIERARVFTQMALQLDIPSVFLAIPSKSNSSDNPAYDLWCVGVPIGNEIYLFEPRWGLPIPTEDQQGIATLREAKANATVLRRAKLRGDLIILSRSMT